MLKRDSFLGHVWFSFLTFFCVLHSYVYFLAQSWIIINAGFDLHTTHPFLKGAEINHDFGVCRVKPPIFGLVIFSGFFVERRFAPKLL